MHSEFIVVVPWKGEMEENRARNWGQRGFNFIKNVLLLYLK